MFAQISSVVIFRVSIFNEALKLGKLIEHYHFHEENDADITFLEFLSIHYIHPQAHDDDYAMDMELPFKCCKDLDQHHSIKLLTQIENESFIFVGRDNTSPMAYYSTNSESRYVGDVWMPPKKMA